MLTPATRNPIPIYNMFTKTTQLIKITVIPQYLEAQSDPAEQHFVWSYTIQIENHSEDTVQLLQRYWHITDARGQVQEVRGPGVIGEQPVLKPGESFRYTSGVPLTTPSGLMHGNYEMVRSNGERFEVLVPAFSLDSPHERQRPN